MSGSMSGMWKRDQGQDSKVLPIEVRNLTPKVTVPHLNLNFTFFLVWPRSLLR